MKREDFYTGEPENTGSPFSQEFITEQESLYYKKYNLARYYLLSLSRP